MNSSEIIIETPSQYYALAYWLSTVIYILPNRKRVSGIEKTGVYTLFLLLIFGTMYINSIAPISFFIPTVLLTIILIFLFIWFSSEINLNNALFFTIQAFILGEFAASFEWQLYFYIISRNIITDSIPASFIFTVIMYSLIFSFKYFIDKRSIKNNSYLQISNKNVITTLTIGFAIYILSNISFVFSNTPFSSIGNADIFNTRTLVDFCGVAILYAYYIQLDERYIESEMNKLQNLLHLQYQNFKISEQSINLVNQKYHDLKHQISILRRGVIENRTEDLDKLENEIKIYETHNKTGNKVLDTIITSVGIKCQTLGIVFTCVVEGEKLSFMNPIELSTLFGNILDNSIEGVSSIAPGNQRLIHLIVAQSRNFIRICIKNNFNGKLIFKNELPVTTKSDKINHGYGLKSIKSIVDNYNGSLTINTEDSWFEIRILIPID